MFDVAYVGDRTNDDGVSGGYVAFDCNGCLRGPSSTKSDPVDWEGFVGGVGGSEVRRSPERDLYPAVVVGWLACEQNNIKILNLYPKK